MSGKKLALKKDNRSIVLAVILLLLALFLPVIHAGESRIATNKIVQREVIDEMARYSLNLDHKIAMIQNGVSLGVEALRIQVSLEDEDYIEILAQIQAISGAYKALFCFPDRWAIDAAGVRYDLEEVDYLDRLTQDTKQMFYVERDGISAGPQSGIVYACPVIRHSNYLGSVLVYSAAEDMMWEFNSAEMYRYAFFTVIDRASRSPIMTCGWEQSQELLDGDLWSNLEKNAESESKWALFNQDVTNHIESSVYCYADGERRFVVATPLKNQDWTLVLAVREKYLTKEAAPITQVNAKFYAELFLLFGGQGFIFIWLILKERKNSEASQMALEGKADLDQFTGLNNKAATEYKIRKYMEENPASQCVLILIDLDNFKKINDTRGHAFGDKVISSVGDNLRRMFRSSDILGRVGGDEFLVFLKDVRDEASIRKECRKLEDFFSSFEVGDYVKYSVSASMGAAVFSKDGASFEELYKNADMALYAAKHRGKNQLMTYKAVHIDE